MFVFSSCILNANTNDDFGKKCIEKKCTIEENKIFRCECNITGKKCFCGDIRSFWKSKISPWAMGEENVTPLFFIDLGVGLGQTVSSYDKGAFNVTSIPKDLRLRVGVPISTYPVAFITDFNWLIYEAKWVDYKDLDVQFGITPIAVKDNKYSHFIIAPGVMIQSSQNTFLAASIGLSLGDAKCDEQKTHRMNPGFASKLVAGFGTGIFDVGLSYICTHNKSNGEKYNTHTIGMFVDLAFLSVSFKKGGGIFGGVGNL